MGTENDMDTENDEFDIKITDKKNHINIKGSITNKMFFPESYPEHPILT